jgi:ABC-type glycerol-3-phosphate transport system substrate-binding protein
MIIVVYVLFVSLLFGCNNAIHELVILVPSKSYVEYLNDTIVKDFHQKHPSHKIRIMTIAEEIPIDFENNPDKYIVKKLKDVDIVVGMPYSQYFAVSNPQNLVDLSEFIGTSSIKQTAYVPILEGLSVGKQIFALPAAFYTSFLLTNVDLKVKYNMYNERSSWKKILESSRLIVRNSTFAERKWRQFHGMMGF